MQQTIKWIGLSLLVLGISVLFWMAVRYENDLPLLPKQSRLEKPMIIEKPIFLEYEKEHLKWKIRAQSAHFFSHSGNANFSNISGSIFSTPKKIIRFRAEEGSMDSRNHRLTLRTNIVVDFSEARTLHTEILYWDVKKKLIFNSVPTQYKSPTLNVSGNNLRLNLDTFEFELLNPRIKVNRL